MGALLLFEPEKTDGREEKRGKVLPFVAAPETFGENAPLGDPGGPLATPGSEPRQARKGATVVTDACAGVRLLGSPSPQKWT